MFVLSLGPGDYINMSLSGPAIVLAVTIDVQHYSIYFFLRARDYINMSLLTSIIAYSHAL